MDQRFKFYEFFCGGGMARAGLGENWECLFANDIDEGKANSYRRNWSSDHLKVDNVANIEVNELPGNADLAWASFPCQDLSLAGNGAGLNGDRSGTFWHFFNLIKKLRGENRAPKIVVLENVYGALTSNKGNDFLTICKALIEENYIVGAVVINASDFLPQSRPRLFFIAVEKDSIDLSFALQDLPDPKWHPKALLSIYEKMDEKVKGAWLWWRLPHPKDRQYDLIDILEKEPTSVNWNSSEQTERLIALMLPLHKAKLEAMKSKGGSFVGAIYKRTRLDNNGIKGQRAEIRFDNLAGCLRTPGGGSSKQTIMLVNNNEVKSRLLSSREMARLMGLPDTYILPERYSEAYHLLGDGVAVPVVSHITQFILEPLIQTFKKSKQAA